MIGAESLVRTLIASGVDTCLANPGTSEMHFVAALDRAPGMRSLLGLFEGVVTGGADAYARMTGKPAVTLMHCGPGLANGLSLLHNAMRARVPIVNIVGDQATYHAPLDPPLATDTAGFARPVSAWVRKVTRTEMLGAEAAAAVQAARASSGIATLILPSDVSWNEGGEVGKPLAVPARPRVSDDAVREAARLLRLREETLILMSGEALSEDGLALAHRIAAAAGARLSAQTFNTRVARGRGRYPLQRIPYVVDDAVRENAGVRNLILVGTGEPVTFFAYPNKPGIATPRDAKVHALARPGDDVLDALARLADKLGAPKAAVPERPSPNVKRGRIAPEAAAETLAALLPEHAIIIEEAITLRNFFYAALMNAAACHGGRHRRARAPRRRGPGGRLGHVHDTGPMDSGAREARRHDDHSQQPQIRGPVQGARRCRRRAGPNRERSLRAEPARSRLDSHGRKHGRGSSARRVVGALHRFAAPLVWPPRPVPDRARDRIGVNSAAFCREIAHIANEA